VETLNREKSQGGEEFTIIRRLHELHELFIRVSVLGLTGEKRIQKSPKRPLLSLEEKVHLCLTDLCAW